MKNKGSVFMGVFVLIIFLLVCYGCYLKMGEMADQVREQDRRQAEKYIQEKDAKRLTK